MLGVMTLNLNFHIEKHGSWAQRKNLVIAAIRENRPDLIAFQAVRKSAGGSDQACELSGFLPEYLHSVFVPTVEREDGTADGSAFLSRFPVEQVEVLRLSLPEQPEDPTPRAVLHGVFRLGHGLFNLVNCHFSWIPEQAKRATSEVLPYIRTSTGPVAIVGDMNSTPDSEAMKSVAEAGFTDLWSKYHPHDPGFTFESERPSIRIDYIWVNGVLRLLAKGIDRVGEASPARPRLSDHLGLIASFDLVG